MTQNKLATRKLIEVSMLDSFLTKIAWKGKESNPKQSILVDVHSHVLPFLDDGAESIEQSLELLRELYALGYRKVIATPHIMNGYYSNTSERIQESLLAIREAMRLGHVDLEIVAAGEYYLDDNLLQKIENGEQLATLDTKNKYLLFETSFVGKPTYLLEAVLRMKKGGYTPVLAHPERYVYLQKDFESLLRLINNGVLFQLNINSLTGYYSKQAQQLAEMLINRKMISFVGTDCHNRMQISNLEVARQLPHYQILMRQNLLNNSLLTSDKIFV